MHYFYVNIILWWLFHVSSIFYAVVFPYTARRWKAKEMYIHRFSLALGSCHKCEFLSIVTLLFFTGLLIPLPAVIVTLIKDNYGYVNAGLPPLFCVPSSGDLSFYSQTFVLNIILVIGIPMLIIVAWTLHKVRFTCGIDALTSNLFE